VGNKYASEYRKSLTICWAADLDSAEMLLMSFSCECFCFDSESSMMSRCHRCTELSSQTVTRWPYTASNHQCPIKAGAIDAAALGAHWGNRRTRPRSGREIFFIYFLGYAQLAPASRWRIAARFKKHQNQQRPGRRPHWGAYCFKHSMKTFLFSGYWRTERSRGVYDSALYKCTFTYLLTYSVFFPFWQPIIVWTCILCICCFSDKKLMVNQHTLYSSQIQCRIKHELLRKGAALGL